MQTWSISNLHPRRLDFDEFRNEFGQSLLDIENLLAVVSKTFPDLPRADFAYQMTAIRKTRELRDLYLTPAVPRHANARSWSAYVRDKLESAQRRDVLADLPRFLSNCKMEAERSRECAREDKSYGTVFDEAYWIGEGIRQRVELLETLREKLP